VNYPGRIENGAVVTNSPLPLPDGTAVVVEPISSSSPSDFWQSASLDELARLQGVPAIRSVDELLGGWPADELDDGFESALADWRSNGSGDRQ